MNPLLTYILKVVICSAIFYAYYLLILRNKSFHPYNRFYLLATGILSFLLPFLHINMFDVASDDNRMLALMQIWTGNSLPTVTVGATRGIPWESVILGTSLTISVTLIIIGLVRIYKVYHLRKVFPKKSIGSVTFINTNIQEAPFSFMKNLFWRKDISLDDAIGEQIYRHEMAHITQRHSWDKLFFQALKAVFWMNPVYYLMQRELLLIHEFIADEKAIQDKDGAAFAQMLLRTQIGAFHYDPAHPVFYSSIKKRLLMITNSQKPRYTYLRRLLVLPLLFAVSFVFAFRAHRIELVQQQKELASITVQGLQQEATNENNLDEVTVVGFTDSKDSTVKPNTGEKVKLKLFSKDPKARPMYVLNGDKEHPLTQAQMKAISPNDIEAISVLKDEKSTSQYGPSGKNGVVLITTKAYSNKQPSDQSKNAETKGLGGDIMNLSAELSPLFVLNGKPISKERAQALERTEMRSVSVLKDKSATSIYGDRAKNGVVMIVTKSDTAHPPVFSEVQQEPSFPGGLAGWKDYLEHHLKMQTPVSNDGPPGVYKVTVSFLVKKTGEVSEVKAIKGPDPDYGCKAEAERVIRESGKWIPAKQNGRIVNFRQKQRIIFQVNK